VSANGERDARVIDGSRVVHEELGERPGGQSRRPDRARGARPRSVKVTVSLSVPTRYVGHTVRRGDAQPVVDDRAKFLQSVKHLPAAWRRSQLSATRARYLGPEGSGADVF
jgi:hypothetical protein